MLITKIAENITKSDEELNLIIQAFLDGDFYFDNPITVSAWRIEKYEMLRRWAYPPMVDYLDAIVKLSSPDLQATGQAQLDQYNLDCLAVKERFPK